MQAIPLPIQPSKEAVEQILEAQIAAPPPHEPATVATHSATSAPPAAAQELGVETLQEIAQPVKVNLDLLDKLMNLVSEMVLARNRLLPFAADFGDHNFSGAVRTIDLLTQELQERMMMTRMQPISHIWSKFPRLIRDVSNECGKQVNLIQDGADTELDRTLLDAIRDPLVHIIRNCIDHGIETPEQRARLGKPAMGQVLLKASHENGMVVIQIADDGGGVDFELVRQKAIEKKLLTAEHALTLTEMQLLEYIFCQDSPPRASSPTCQAGVLAWTLSRPTLPRLVALLRLTVLGGRDQYLLENSTDIGRDARLVCQMRGRALCHSAK